MVADINILTKGQFAAQLGVKPSAVSNYITRGKLSAPAVRPDGRIDASLAREQLAGRLNPPETGKSAKRPPALPISTAITPLRFMLDIMNDESLAPARRDRMAIAAAPFCHPRLSEPVGKKDARKAAAAAASAGWFAPGAPPKLVIVNNSSGPAGKRRSAADTI